MIHQFESESSLVTYDVIQKDNECAVAIELTNKTTGKLIIKELRSMPGTEDQLLALWKEKNDSKYVKSYN